MELFTAITLIRFLIEALAQLQRELFISEVGEKLDFNIFWKTHKIPHWMSSVRGKKCIFMSCFCKRARQGHFNVKLIPQKQQTGASKVTRAPGWEVEPTHQNYMLTPSWEEKLEKKMPKIGICLPLCYFPYLKMRPDLQSTLKVRAQASAKFDLLLILHLINLR